MKETPAFMNRDNPLRTKEFLIIRKCSWDPNNKH